MKDDEMLCVICSLSVCVVVSNYISILYYHQWIQSSTMSKITIPNAYGPWISLIYSTYSVHTHEQLKELSKLTYFWIICVFPFWFGFDFWGRLPFSLACRLIREIGVNFSIVVIKEIAPIHNLSYFLLPWVAILCTFDINKLC